MFKVDIKKSLPNWQSETKENKVCVHKIKQMRKKNLSNNSLLN